MSLQPLVEVIEYVVPRVFKLACWVLGTAAFVWVLVLLTQALGWTGNGGDMGCTPSPTGCF